MCVSSSSRALSLSVLTPRHPMCKRSINVHTNQVYAYLLGFRKYDWLWKEDKDVQYKRFASSNPAISDYEVIGQTTVPYLCVTGPVARMLAAASTAYSELNRLYNRVCLTVALHLLIIILPCEKETAVGIQSFFIASISHRIRCLRTSTILNALDQRYCWTAVCVQRI